MKSVTITLGRTEWATILSCTGKVRIYEGQDGTKHAKKLNALIAKVENKIFAKLRGEFSEGLPAGKSSKED